ncbi:MAG: DinB family protein [Cytophagales bacterium]|nr:DinB family protein [Cytophagales bacterium]
MNREELETGLFDSHQRFIDLMNQLSKEDFEFRLNDDKWSNGENLLHILKSTKPLGQALALPNFQLKLIFGKSNRPSRTFDELVSKYKNKLRDGGKAKDKFIPSNISFDQRAEVVKKLSKTINQIMKHFAAFSEENLDHLILPHPLLGKLTLREMMYFTIYHVQHHQKIVERNLEAH